MALMALMALMAQMILMKLMTHHLHQSGRPVHTIYQAMRTNIADLVVGSEFALIFQSGQNLHWSCSRVRVSMIASGFTKEADQNNLAGRVPRRPRSWETVFESAMNQEECSTAINMPS